MPNFSPFPLQGCAGDEEKDMTQCPACGYVETPSDKKLARFYAKNFGDIPVLEMMQRQWISVEDKESVSQIWKAIFRFFEVESKEELDALSWG